MLTKNSVNSREINIEPSAIKVEDNKVNKDNIFCFYCPSLS